MDLGTFEVVASVVLSGILLLTLAGLGWLIKSAMVTKTIAARNLETSQASSNEQRQVFVETNKILKRIADTIEHHDFEFGDWNYRLFKRLVDAVEAHNELLEAAAKEPPSQAE
jgi:hypothetical protein